MNEKISWIILSLLIPIFVLNSQSYGRKGKPNRGQGGMERPGMFMMNPEVLKEKINLNDEQLAAVTEINKKFREKMDSIHDKMKPKREALEKLVTAENVDRNKAKILLEEMSTLKVEAGMIRINHRLEIEKVLDARQQEKLRSMIKTGIKKAGQRGGFGGHGDCPCKYKK